MLVLFLSFAVLRISVSLTTETNLTLKDQLQRSLSHVNDMLADIEGKIESERKFLTRLDYDVNFKDEPRFMEYPTTDIWWEDFRLPLPGTTKQQAETTRILSVRQAVLNTTVSDNQRPNLTTRITLIASAKSPNLSAQITTTTAHSESHDPLIRGIVKKWVRQSNHSQSLVSESDIPITVPVYTSSTPSVLITTEDMALDMIHPPNWPFPNNSAGSESLLQQDLKNYMVINHLGYGSAFIVKFSELIGSKDIISAAALTKAFTSEADKLIAQGTFSRMGPDIVKEMKKLLNVLVTSDIENTMDLARLSHFIFKNKDQTLEAPVKQIVDYYDKMFKKEEGEELFATLEALERYPEGGKSPEEICERIFKAYFAPFTRLDGTSEQKTLIRLIFQAITKFYITWRALYMDSDKNIRGSGTVEHMGLNTNDTTVRRSMNYKKIVQHLLHKHPRVLKKLNKHHKVRRLRDHHRDSRDYHDYEESRLKKHGYSSHRFRQRAISYSIYETDPDSTDSVFYNEHHINHVSSHRKKVLQQIKRRNRMKRRKNRRERRKQRRYQKQKQRQRLYMSTRSTITVATTTSTSSAAATPAIRAIAPAARKPIPGLSPDYLKQLAISYFRKKQATQNFRRLNIPSSDEEIYNMSEDPSNSTTRKNSIKSIRGGTSYSDEEDYLRNNLNDAMRHGNRTVVMFRALNNEDSMVERIRDSSKETDNEWVLKNNIYKVFEKKNHVFRK